MLLPLLGTVALLAPLVYLWQASLVPSRFTVHQMGYADHGVGPGGHGPGGHGPGGHGPGGGHAAGSRHGSGHERGHRSAATSVSVDTLTADPARPADVRVDLVAAAASLDIGGRAVPGFTVNGTSPGPTITATAGDLVEVRLRNASVAEGVALHWHGIDVPNAMDGVAGVTQDAVAVGGAFTYRFVVDRVGTYWYHSHQLSHRQVAGGLLGALVVQPNQRAATPAGAEVLALAHTYAGVKTLNGRPGDLRVEAGPGQPVRVRVVNTDLGPIEVWADGEYRALAVDGTDLHRPGPVRDRSVTVTAGGRVDLGLVMPADGSPRRVQVSRGTAVVLGGGEPPPPPPQPSASLDLLAYGAPTGLGFDPDRPDRTFDYRIGRRPGFVRGMPGLWWTVNGRTFPDVPMFVVREGEVIRMRIADTSGEVHPMHLHGHRAVVLARNGVPATGSPWWVDSLNVRDGETYEIALVADNPGIWMDHCHNLLHAADGMVAHLMYEGVTTPYAIGKGTPNHPE